MTVRTKEEQKAYLDGFEMCAECIERYLSDKGKKKLECLLSAVRNAVKTEDVESEKINCKSTKCKSCMNHNYCDFEPQESQESSE